MADPFEQHERRSAEQAAAYAVEERALRQAKPASAADDLTLEERVRARVENAIWKRDGKMLYEPRGEDAVRQEATETIENWTNTELLSAISLELQEMAEGK